MSSRFLRGGHPNSPSIDRAGQGQDNKCMPSNSEGHLLSLGSSLAPEDNAMPARNVAEVGLAAATVAVYNSQSPSATPQATLMIPPPWLSAIGPSPKSGHLRNPETRNRSHDWDHGDPDLAEAGVVGGHDAPNWSRTKSSMILLGATILYAVIAGLSRFGFVKL